MQLRNSDKLHRAMKSLEDAIKYSHSAEYQGIGIEFKSVLQAAVVQNFSLTFKVCQQMLYYQLLDLHGKEAVSDISSEVLFRMSAEGGLIEDVDRWLEYLDCEHLTHSSTVPLRTFEKASSFLFDAGKLLQTCAKRSNNERRRVA